MHVDHELVEFVPMDKQDYEEVIEEYKEEILMPEGAPEPFGDDFVDPPPAQGKPRCITPIWMINEYIYIYIWCAFMLQAFYGNYMHKYIYLWVLLV